MVNGQGLPLGATETDNPGKDAEKRNVSNSLDEQCDFVLGAVYTVLKPQLESKRDMMAEFL